MAPIDLFQPQRPRLFAIAYRMLGSASEAEDVLQDAWLRFAAAETAELRSAEAFATTIVTRLCLDRLKSARARREEYVGPWLPEPVLTAGADRDGADVLAERSESLTLAFLLMLETLSPEERAVFLLKEAFDYEHAEIAELLGISVASSRQLLHRARGKIRPPRPETASAARVPREVAERFAAAFRDGDVETLTQLLAADVTFVADGGGKAAASRKPFFGREDVVRLLVGFRRAGVAQGLLGHVTLESTEINAEPAVVIRIDGRLDGVYVLSVGPEGVTGIRVVRNPEKLRFLERQLAGG